MRLKTRKTLFPYWMRESKTLFPTFGPVIGGLPGIAFCGWKLIKMNKPRRIDYAVVNKQQPLPVLFARIHAKKKVILLLHLSLVYQD